MAEAVRILSFGGALSIFDDEEDYSFPTWAGVIPLDVTVGTPIRDERCQQELPAYLENYSRKRKE